MNNDDCFFVLSGILTHMEGKPEGYTFGRPTKYRKEFCQVAVDYMAQGYSQTALAGHLGIAKQTLYEWMDAHPDFADAISVAKPKRVDKLERDLLSTDNAAVVNSRKFALLNADRDEWKDRRDVSADVDGRLSVEAFLSLMGELPSVGHKP